ncbi:MAG: hypothetical protein AAFQ22_10240 [Pseudomonadota bacterium]
MANPQPGDVPTMAKPPISLVQRALLPIGIVQFLVPTLPRFGVGSDIADTANESMMRAPETPPGVFFAIWGIIFSAYLGTALWAQFSRDHVIARIAPSLASAGVASIIWMLLRQGQISDVLGHLVLVAMFISAYVAARRFDETRGMGGSPGRWVSDVTTGMLAGWMTLALALSTSELVRTLFGIANTDAEWWMLGFTLLIAVGCAQFAFSKITASPYFVLAFAWGILGVILNLWINVELHVPAVLTSLLATFVLIRRLRLGATGARARP